MSVEEQCDLCAMTIHSYAVSIYLTATVCILHMPHGKIKIMWPITSAHACQERERKKEINEKTTRIICNDKKVKPFDSIITA